MSKTKPNILLVMADQLAPQFLPAYGHTVVRTPHLDRVCEQGAIFTAAYTNFPLCAPARYSMMTGCLPSSIDAWDNAAELAAGIPTFAHYLSRLGYKTCLSGKMHFCGPDQLHGFEQRLTTDVYPSDFTWTPDWDEPDRHHGWYHGTDVVAQAGVCVRSNNLDYDDEVTFQARRYVYDRARDGSDEPFCLVVSYIHPHDPYITRAQYWDLYSTGDVDLPVVDRAAAPSDPHSDRLISQTGIDRAALSEEQVRNARHAYYGSISYIDDQVGELLECLEETGLSRNTVIVFTADHGDMLGERGLWFKMSWFEHSARVPLVISFPTAVRPRTCGGAVSLVDLLPTLVDFATDGGGMDYQSVMDGRSLLPELSGAEGHDEVFGQYFAEHTAEPLFMLRRGTRKLVSGGGDPPLFFDLAEDPAELDNLANDTGHAGMVAAWSDEIRSRWDAGAIKERILVSQRRRRAVQPAFVKQRLSWDFQPVVDAGQAYIRNNLDIHAIERRSRFPAVK